MDVVRLFSSSELFVVHNETSKSSREIFGINCRVGNSGRINVFVPRNWRERKTNMV